MRRMECEAYNLECKWCYLNYPHDQKGATDCKECGDFLCSRCSGEHELCGCCDLDKEIAEATDDGV